MKAVVIEKYGSPEILQIKEIEKPVPKDDEVLIKVFASSATLYDCWHRSSTAPAGFGLLSKLGSGFRKPKQPTPGMDFAGEIEVVGKNVSKFKKNDQVYGISLSMGTNAEYICLPESGSLTFKPINMTYEEAAAIPYGALTSLYFLRKANIQKEQKVLVFGASGGVGIFAVQLAKYFGAEVTGVCSSEKLDLVKSLGVERVIDYTTEDFTKSDEVYDIIFDTVGRSSVSRSRGSLKKEGSYVFATFGLPKLLQMLWLKLTSRKKVILGLVEDKVENLNFLKDLAEEGTIKPTIDKVFPIEQVAEAHAYIEKGLKKGQVVLTL